jgi:hypothetical protein
MWVDSGLGGGRKVDKLRDAVAGYSATRPWGISIGVICVCCAWVRMGALDLHCEIIEVGSSMSRRWGPGSIVSGLIEIDVNGWMMSTWRFVLLS